MLPTIVVVKDQKTLKHFLKEIQKKHQIQKMIEIKPQGKKIVINQIREIKKISIFDENKSFLILIYHFDLADVEAQSAFIKTLEEKTEKKFIIITVENINKLLPTVTSRCQIIDLTKRENSNDDLSINEKLIKLFQAAQNNTKLDFLNNTQIYNVDSEKVLAIIKNIIIILKNKLDQRDKSTVFLIKEGLKLQRLIENNNLNPQLAIDNYLILINKVYNKNRDDKKNKQ
jgi:DNA polymerase III delta prime subunit